MTLPNNLIDNYLNQLSLKYTFLKSKQQIQSNQLKVILNDYIKAKSKCIQLSSELGIEFQRKQHYEKFQQKINDQQKNQQNIEEIVIMKNQLIKNLTELLDFEHQLVYKKEKLQISSTTMTTNNFPPEISKFNLEIPNYLLKNQQNLLKIDHITNFVQDLRKNMRKLSNKVFKKYQINEFLMNQPQYLQVKQQYQRLKKKNQELNEIIKKKVKIEKQRFFENCQKLQENDQYVILKVYEKDIKNIGKQYQYAQIGDTNTHFQNRSNTKNNKISNKLNQQIPQLSDHKKDKNNNIQSQESSFDQQKCVTISRIQQNQRKNRSNTLGKEKNEQSNQKQNTQTKINEFDVNKNKQQQKTQSTFLSKILQIRQKRKKVIDDSVWTQLEKI